MRDFGRIVDSAVAETSGTLSSFHLSTEPSVSRSKPSRLAILESAPVRGAAGFSALDQAIQRAGRGVNHPDFDLTSFISTLLDAVRTTGFDVQYSAS